MREENITKMDFKQLRTEVQYLRDELAIFKRKYEDAIYNLDSDNFGKGFVIAQDNMKAQIKITAEALKSTLTKDDLANELTQYSTIEQTAGAITATVTEEYVKTLIGNSYVTDTVLQSRIEQTADSILSTVSASYQTIGGASEEYDSLWSKIEQTAGSITSVVSKNISACFEYGIKPTKSNTTPVQRSMLCLYDGAYYYFNDISGTWEEYPADGLTTMFKQTASGFEFTGGVEISGDLISGGVISGSALANEEGTHILKMVNDNGTGKGTFQLLEQDDESPYFGIYSIDNYKSTWLTAHGYGFLRIITDVGGEWQPEAQPKGTWNFSECTVNNLIVPARFG